MQSAAIMADIDKQILAKLLHYANEVIKVAGQANLQRQECLEIRAKTEKLAGLLRQAALISSDLYERPRRRIIADTEQVLDKALTLVFKCRSNGLRRILTIIPQGAFRKVSQHLENSIGDVSWLLRASTSACDRDDEYLGLPPIATNEPILCFIWEQIAILCSGSIEERTNAAALLVSLAGDSDRCGSLIIEEGGVPPLLKLAKEGRMEGQENAARAIGLLGRETENVEHIVNAGVCQVFAEILREGDMKVQIVVAWAVAELAAHNRKCQDLFAQHNMIQLLFRHLAWETIPDYSEYAMASKESMAIHSIVMANHSPEKILHEHKHHGALPGSSIKHKELEDPATKAEMRSMSARALRYLCAGNVTICRSITESTALLCLAVLLGKGHDEVRCSSATALMEITAVVDQDVELEITAVAEQDAELRSSSFKTTAPFAKAAKAAVKLVS